MQRNFYLIFYWFFESTAGVMKNDVYSFVISHLILKTALRRGALVFPESPDLFSQRSADSEGPLTAPSHFPVSPCFSSGETFYARSFFSEEDDPPSLLPSASEQVDDLADQSLVRLFNTNNHNV